MKILVASCHFPYPEVPHAGGETLYHIIESLSLRHRIHLLSLIKKEESQFINSLKPLCERVEIVYRSSTLLEKMVGTAKLVILSPLLVGHRTWYDLRSRATKLLQNYQYDIVIIEFTETAPFIPSFNHFPTIIDVPDIISKSPERERLYRKCGSFPRLKGSLSRQELSIYRKADRILVKSESEMRYLKSKDNNLAIDVFPTWIRTNNHLSSGTVEERNSILFVGALDREANSDAIEYFLKNIYPFVLEKIPDVKFTVVGGGASARLRKHCSQPGVQFTGYVPKVEPFYQKATIFVAPLKVGGGIIVKILDAMAAGKAVVTTTAGNEGIGATSGRELIVADQPKIFAEKVVALLSNEDLRNGIGYNAKMFIKCNFNWNLQIDRLESILSDCIQRRKT